MSDEYFGKFPIKTEITVIGKSSLGLEGWSARIYAGVEALRPGSKEMFLSVGDLVVGSEIEFYDLFDRLCRLSVVSVSGIKADADNGFVGAFLEFGIDDRKCWVVTGAYNSSALKSLEIPRE
jgi:hypothetical protein